MAAASYIRFVDRHSGEKSTFPLYDVGESGDFAISHDGTVQDFATYDLEFLSTHDMGRNVRVSLSFGEDSEYCASGCWLRRDQVQGTPLNAYRIYFASEVPPSRLFNMSFGFVRVFVEAEPMLGANGKIRGVTQDIPCFTDGFADRNEAIASMLWEIAVGGNPTASSWMVAGREGQDNAFSLLDGASQEDESRSLRAFLGLVGAILNGYESNMPFLRARAHSRVAKHDQTVGARSVRKVGKREVRWIARNVSQLYECASRTDIAVNGTYYLPQHVLTEKTTRTYDNTENRFLLAFLESVIAGLAQADKLLQESLAEPMRIYRELEVISAGKGMLPAKVIVAAGINRERRLLEQVGSLRQRASRLRMSLRRMFPDVAPAKFAVPRRSKVLQEVGAYYQLYNLAKQWESFGKVSLARDGLALNTFRMDKLYEYYALLKILTWLAEKGFVPDKSYETPICSPLYTTTEPHYLNETEVATVYRLVRGKVKVTLHYQPVFYGDETEEGGVTLHRTVASDVFAAGGGKGCIYTPDYLISFDDGEGGPLRRVVLDAKFSRIKDLSSRDDGPSRFEACNIKYRLNTGEAWPGPGVSAVWLLAGRDASAGPLLFQGTNWARSNQGFVPSGIVALTPGTNGLDTLFKRIGLAGMVPEAKPTGAKRETGASLPGGQTAQPERSKAAAGGSLGVWAREGRPDRQEGELGKPQDEDRLEVGRTSPPKAEAPSASAETKGPCPADTGVAPTPAQGGTSPRREPAATRARVVARWRQEVDREAAKRLEKTERKESEEAERRAVEQRRSEHTAAMGTKRQYELAGDVEGLIRSLVEHHAKPDDLLSQAVCNRLLGIPRPLLAKDPAPEDARFYDATPRPLLGSEYFVFANWKSKHLDKLRKQEAKSRRKASSKTSSPSDAAEQGIKTPSKQPKSRARKGDPLEMLEEIFLLKQGSPELFSSSFSRKFNLADPVFLRNPPKAGKKRFERVVIEGADLYVYKDWDRARTALLSNYLESCKGGKEES